MAPAQIKCDRSTHVVADDQRFLQLQLGALPCYVIGKTLDRVLLLRSVALPVTAKVDRYNVPTVSKIFDLVRLLFSVLAF